VPLTLQCHNVGEIAVIECRGRVVDGAETASLHRQFLDLLPVHRFFVVDLHDVSFVDSAGLGLLVRLLSRARASAGDLKLCGAGPGIEHTLTVTRLKTVLGACATQGDAIAALYHSERGNDLPIRAAVDIVCIHSSADVLAYLRELMRQAGYAVLTTHSVADALTLIRATEPRIVVIETALRDWMTGGMPEIFNLFAEGADVIDLAPGFTTEDAGSAGARLLEDLQRRMY
jgi:anti-sigma B factor antagonist